MKCELKYIYHTQKKAIKNTDLKELISHWKAYILIFVLLSILGYFTQWISSIILFVTLCIYLYYEAHEWCKNRNKMEVLK